MASIASLIDFLMSLMREEKTRLAFERDPEGTLADRGLDNVTGQDVRDARLMMADDGMARPRPAARQERGGGDDDAVREIRHTTNNFEVTEVGDINQTIVAIDDRDTTIVDSFNSDTKVVAIQDNDVIDNSTDNSVDNDVDNDVDVISIEDNDTTVPAQEAGAEEGAEPEPGSATDPAPEPEVGIDPVEAGPQDVPFDIAPEPEPEPDVLDQVAG